MEAMARVIFVLQTGRGQALSVAREPISARLSVPAALRHM
jgi:hypothetical protein